MIKSVQLALLSILVFAAAAGLATTLAVGKPSDLMAAVGQIFNARPLVTSTTTNYKAPLQKIKSTATTTIPQLICIPSKLSFTGSLAGATSPAIKVLQGVLVHNGFNISSDETKNSLFGNTTKKAIQDFEKQNGIPQTGTIDQATRKALDAKYGCIAVIDSITAAIRAKTASTTVSGLTGAAQSTILKVAPLSVTPAQKTSSVSSQSTKAMGVIAMDAGPVTNPNSIIYNVSIKAGHYHHDYYQTETIAMPANDKPDAPDPLGYTETGTEDGDWSDTYNADYNPTPPGYVVCTNQTTTYINNDPSLDQTFIIDRCGLFNGVMANGHNTGHYDDGAGDVWDMWDTYSSNITLTASTTPPSAVGVSAKISVSSGAVKTWESNDNGWPIGVLDSIPCSSLSVGGGGGADCTAIIDVPLNGTPVDVTPTTDAPDFLYQSGVSVKMPSSNCASGSGSSAGSPVNGNPPSAYLLEDTGNMSFSKAVINPDGSTQNCQGEFDYNAQSATSSPTYNLHAQVGALDVSTTSGAIYVPTNYWDDEFGAGVTRVIGSASFSTTTGSTTTSYSYKADSHTYLVTDATEPGQQKTVTLNGISAAKIADGSGMLNSPESIACNSLSVGGVTAVNDPTNPGTCTVTLTGVSSSGAKIDVTPSIAATNFLYKYSVSQSNPVVVVTLSGGFTGPNNAIFDWVNNNLNAVTVRIPGGTPPSIARGTVTLERFIEDQLSQGNKVLVIGHSIGSITAYAVQQLYSTNCVASIYVDPPYNTFFSKIPVFDLLPTFSEVRTASTQGLASDPNSVIWTDGKPFIGTNFFVHDAFDHPNYGKNATNLNGLSTKMKSVLATLANSRCNFSTPQPEDKFDPPPIIGSIQTSSGQGIVRPGDNMTISGSGFGTDDMVRIEDVADPEGTYYELYAESPDASGDSISFTMPDSPEIADNVASGAYIVEVSGLNSDYSNTFPITVQLNQSPSVNPSVSGSPTPGGTVTVSGSGFSSIDNTAIITPTAIAAYIHVNDFVANALSAAISIFDSFTFTALDGVKSIFTAAIASASNEPYAFIDSLASDGYTLSFTLPSDMPLGSYDINIKALRSGWSTSVPLSVTATPPNPPASSTPSITVSSPTASQSFSNATSTVIPVSYALSNIPANATLMIQLERITGNTTFGGTMLHFTDTGTGSYTLNPTQSISDLTPNTYAVYLCDQYITDPNKPGHALCTQSPTFPIVQATTSAISAPTSLSATRDSLGDIIHISWQAGANATSGSYASYKVETATNPVNPVWNTNTPATISSATTSWAYQTGSSWSANPLFRARALLPDGTYTAYTNIAQPSFVPPVFTLTANPTSIQQGATTTLTWRMLSDHWTSCMGSGGDPGWNQSPVFNGLPDTSAGGTYVASPPSPWSYSLTCTSLGGTTTQSVAIAVSPAAEVTPPVIAHNPNPILHPTPPLPTATLTANPPTIVSGQTTTLSWTSANAVSCQGQLGTAGVNTTYPTSGSTQVGPLTTSGTERSMPYVISCTGAGGTAPANVSVFVMPDATSTPVTAAVTATPSSITSGQTSTLTWSSTGATVCKASGQWNGLPGMLTLGTSGSMTTPILTTPYASGTYHLYTLSCTGANNMGAISQAYVFVVGTSTATTTSYVEGQGNMAAAVVAGFSNGLKFLLRFVIGI